MGAKSRKQTLHFPDPTYKSKCICGGVCFDIKICSETRIEWMVIGDVSGRRLQSEYIHLVVVVVDAAKVILVIESSRRASIRMIAAPEKSPTKRPSLH